MFYDSTQNFGSTVATGDFNEDGKPDYVYGGASMTLRLGNGDGTFQPATTFGSAGRTVDIAVADLNKDGHLDIVTASVTGPIAIFYGKGDGTFTTGAPIAVNSNLAVESIAVGDFNGDGLPDIAAGLSNGTVQIYTNAGGNSFIAGNTISVDPSGLEVMTVRAGDVDMNGALDLAVGTGTGAYVLWGDGKGGFTPVLLKAYPNGPGGYAFMGDLNQDGSDDILVYSNCSSEQEGSKASSDCTNIDVFYGGQGPQKTFYRAAETQLPIGVYATDLRAVDINGDGIADIAVSARDTNGSQEGMFFYLGKPDGSFSTTPERYIVTSDGVANFALADFNRDGMMDVVQVLDSALADEVYLNATKRAPCATSAISPTVTLCSPVDGTYSLSPVTLQATTYDANTVTALQLYQDGSLVYNQPATTFNLTETLGAGPHMFVAKAWDYTGMSFHTNRNIFVYSGTPGAVCPAAASAAAICVVSAAGVSPVHIVANANTSYVPTAIQLYVDGSLVVDNESPSTAIDTEESLSSGTHSLVVKLYDAQGNVAMASQNVTVN